MRTLLTGGVDRAFLRLSCHQPHAPPRSLSWLPALRASPSRAAAFQSQGSTQGTLLPRSAAPSAGTLFAGTLYRHAWRSASAPPRAPKIRVYGAGPDEALPKAEGDDRQFCVVNFYHLTSLADAGAELEAHKAFVQENALDMQGRIYINRQGINAQYSGPEEDAHAYARWLETREGFQGLYWWSDRVDGGHQFPRLMLKSRKQLVSVGKTGELDDVDLSDPSKRAVKLSPAEWKMMLRGLGAAPGAEQEELEELGAMGAAAQAAEGGGAMDWKKPVMLDVRNSYEWEGGHFKGAMRPDVEEFKATPFDTPMGLPVDKEQPIMMYCTGGIRCDVYSAVLKKKGYKNLYTLEGGVHNYIREEGTDLWDGALFVFDGRLAVAGEKAWGACHYCGGEAAPRHHNCHNVDCNMLFLSCETCVVQSEGACSAECRNSVRLRPYKGAPGYFKRWGQYHDGSGVTQQPGDAEGKTYDGPPRRVSPRAGTKSYHARKSAKKAAARQEVNTMIAAAAMGADVSKGGAEKVH